MITKGVFPKCIYGSVCQDLALPGHAVNSVKHVITATQFHLMSIFVTNFLSFVHSLEWEYMSAPRIFPDWVLDAHYS